MKESDRSLTNPIIQGIPSDPEQLRREYIQLYRYKHDLETLLNNTEDFIYIKDHKHKFIYTSKAFARLTKHDSFQELVGKDDFDIFPPEHARRYFEAEQTVITEGKTLSRHEEPYYDLNNQLCWVSSTKNPVFDDQGNVIGLVGISKDITELKRQTEKIQYLAHHDDLTGLLNHRALFEFGGVLLSAAQRDHFRLFALYLDLDGFKQVNDLHGHTRGDEVLKAFARIIQDSIRNGDLAARMGGDEFLILMSSPYDQANAAKQFALRFIETVRDKQELLSGCSCSIGIVLAQQQETLDSLIKAADSAMYIAKRDPIARYVITER